MPDSSDPTDTYKFVLLRVPIVDKTNADLRCVLELGGRRLQTLAAMPLAQRTQTARRFFNANRGNFEAALQSPIASRLLALITSDPTPKDADLQKSLSAEKGPELDNLKKSLAEGLTLALYAQVPSAWITSTSRLYRLCCLATGEVEGVPRNFPSFMSAPIVLRSPASATPPLPDPQVTSSSLNRVTPLPIGQELLLAISELERFDSKEYLFAPALDGTQTLSHVASFSMKTSLVLSEATRKVLSRYGLNVDSRPLTEAITRLEEVLRRLPSQGLTGSQMTSALAGPTPSSLPVQGYQAPLVQMRQVAQHLLVRQHLKKYDPIDVSHIQNVLPKESNSRTHRALERTETERRMETEETEEHNKEHETAQRTELNRESKQAVNEEATTRFELSLTGNYGPSVEFSSEFGMESSTVKEDSENFATSFAKNVTDRTVDRIGSRTLTSLIVRTQAETEEINIHGLEGKDDPYRGIYHYVDKVYEAQVFDIGSRTVADFQVPEPGSFLSSLTLPTSIVGADISPPPKLTDYIQSPSEITELNYRRLSGIFGVDDIPSPPPRYRTLTGTFRQPEQGVAKEQGRPQYSSALAFDFPPGYRPWRVRLQGIMFTDEDIVLGISMPAVSILWQAPAVGVDPSAEVSLGEGDVYIKKLPPIEANLSEALPGLPEDAAMEMSLHSWESGTFTISVELLCRRTQEGAAAWQNAVYRELMKGAERLELRYEADLAESRSRAGVTEEAAFTMSPTEAEIVIRNELKRACMSILLPAETVPAREGTFLDDSDTTINGSVAEGHAGIVTFMEQAFEWENLQYVFYPYFWGRRSKWETRLTLSQEQPELKTLMQAGAARVVVPLRTGYGADMATFLATQGSTGASGGEFVPEHYLPIDQELRARAGAGPDGLPLGSPWEVRVPTRLVYLRDSEALPVWTRSDQTKWEWELSQ